MQLEKIKKGQELLKKKESLQREVKIFENKMSNITMLKFTDDTSRVWARTKKNDILFVEGVKEMYLSILKAALININLEIMSL